MSGRLILLVDGNNYSQAMKEVWGRPGYRERLSQTLKEVCARRRGVVGE